ncbi:DNA-binding protein [Bienertia sinuspersici]
MPEAGHSMTWPKDSENEDPFSSYEEYNVDSDVQKRKKCKKYPVFDEKTDMKKVQLSAGLKFTSRAIFKEAIIAYSIQQHKDLIYLKNDKRFIGIGCANCRWELTLGPDIEDPTGWKIKSLQPLHERCTRTFSNRLITVNWLVNEYLDRILRNPLMKATEMKDDMRARYDIVVGLRQCQRAKVRALNAVVNLMKKQYGILKPYLVELVKSNPGTTDVALFGIMREKGFFLPPDIVKKGHGKKKTVRRKDADEPSKGKFELQ